MGDSVAVRDNSDLLKCSPDAGEERDTKMRDVLRISEKQKVTEHCDLQAEALSTLIIWGPKRLHCGPVSI